MKATNQVNYQSQYKKSIKKDLLSLYQRRKKIQILPQIVMMITIQKRNPQSKAQMRNLMKKTSMIPRGIWLSLTQMIINHLSNSKDRLQATPEITLDLKISQSSPLSLNTTLLIPCTDISFHPLSRISITKTFLLQLPVLSMMITSLPLQFCLQKLLIMPQMLKGLRKIIGKS